MTDGAVTDGAVTDGAVTDGAHRKRPARGHFQAVGFCLREQARTKKSHISTLSLDSAARTPLQW